MENITITVYTKKPLTFKRQKAGIFHQMKLTIYRTMCNKPLSTAAAMLGLRYSCGLLAIGRDIF